MVAVVGILAYLTFRIVKMGIQYSENVERIKHGYPTIDGASPLHGASQEEASSDGAYADAVSYSN